MSSTFHMNASISRSMDLPSLDGLSLMQSKTCTVDDGQNLCHVNPALNLRERPISSSFHFHTAFDFPKFEPDRGDDDDDDEDDMMKEESPTPSPPPMLRPSLTLRPTFTRGPPRSGSPDSEIVDNPNMMGMGSYSSTCTPEGTPGNAPLDYGYSRINDFVSPSFPTVASNRSMSMIDESDDDDNELCIKIDENEHDDILNSYAHLRSPSACSVAGSDCSSSSNCSSSSLGLLDLVMSIDKVDEDTVLVRKGYVLDDKLKDTLQGELWMGRDTRSGKVVAIKKVDRVLHEKRESKEECGMTYLVEQDIDREADVLKTLSTDPQLSIVRYLDFFESDAFLYLVTEYVEGVSMDEFIRTAHRYIKEGRMRHFQWTQMVKKIMSQIVASVNRMHTVHKCCHLNLFMENFKVNGVSFIEHDDGSVTMEGDIKVTLLDFGVAEIFDCTKSKSEVSEQPTVSPFICSKTRLSIFREIQQSPESIIEEEFDASLADMWSIGMILYEAMVGVSLFENMEDDAYVAVQNGELHSYMVEEKLLRLFQPQSFSLLEGLLETEPETRLTSPKAEQHDWFNPPRQNAFLYTQSDRKALSNKSKSKGKGGKK